MTYFRKKPVVIQAVKFDVDFEPSTAPVWLQDALIGNVAVLIRDNHGLPYWLKVNTLEGVMTADLGDWIILGVENEIYSCKDSVFAASYDEVPEEEMLSEATLEKALREIRKATDAQGVQLTSDVRQKSRI